MDFTSRVLEYRPMCCPFTSDLQVTFLGRFLELINFIPYVFGLARPGLEPTISCIRGGQSITELSLVEVRGYCSISMMTLVMFMSILKIYQSNKAPTIFHYILDPSYVTFTHFSDQTIQRNIMLPRCRMLLRKRTGKRN